MGQRQRTEGFAMRVLLISPNTEMLPDPVFPLGLAFLSGALKRSSHEHQLLDLCFVDDYGKALEQAVADFSPEVIGLSLRNVDNVAYPNTHSYLPFYRKVVSHLRKLTSATIVLGGSGFSLMPRQILNDLEADYGMVGEGEILFVRFLDRLARGQSLVQLPGVITRRNHRPPDAIPAQRSSIRKMIMPRREKLDNEAYLRFGGMGNVQTKRGCTFSCVYCTYPLLEGSEIRLRSPKEIGEEIQQLYDQGVDNVFIVDNVFNFPPHHAQSICKELLRRNLEVKWSCYLHPQFVTESLLSLMKESGCTGVEFGTDAGSDLVLKGLGKSFTKEEVRRASQLCHKVGLPSCHSLVLGGPGESKETLLETFALMDEVSPTAVIAMVGIRLFPGTKLAESTLPEDLIIEDDSMLKPTFFLAESVRPFVLDMLYEHVEKNKNWILPGSNVNIDRRLQEKLRRFGLKGPLWEHMQVRRK
jgi:radical SAM superfamily enzyme YgiQ (UPF0313 family)